MGGIALKGSHVSAIDKRIEIVAANIFSKSKGDSFSNPGLEAFMIKNRINGLYLTGLDAEYCVYATAKGGLNRGYKVNIITDTIIIGTKNHRDSIIKKTGRTVLTLLHLNNSCKLIDFPDIKMYMQNL
jgi:nicotinamidase-related amidase